SWVSWTGVKATKGPRTSHGKRWSRVWLDRLIGSRSAPPFAGAYPAPVHGKLPEPGRDSQPMSMGGAAADPGSESYAMTLAGAKLHRLQPDGRTLCGFDSLQMVLVENPPPNAMLCEWCA